MPTRGSTKDIQKFQKGLFGAGEAFRGHMGLEDHRSLQAHANHCGHRSLEGHNNLYACSSHWAIEAFSAKKAFRAIVQEKTFKAVRALRALGPLRLIEPMRAVGYRRGLQGPFKAIYFFEPWEDQEEKQELGGAQPIFFKVSSLPFFWLFPWLPGAPSNKVKKNNVIASPSDRPPEGPV